MANKKKVAPKGAYDKQFVRTMKKNGKWRGKKIYTKYKKAKKLKRTPYLYNDVIIVPLGVSCTFKIEIPAKLVYQNKV